eukprot:TRINITY_DN4622_c0_g1_i1.p1 TRINITY_DN4622_c0_g1~~TRINITY_DN4622_c0_g1_i1.p1  ORF type:complete len:180 (-),score=43.66 TRINITY_DN4622_c0_g1_i1:32-571(-)
MEQQHLAHGSNYNFDHPDAFDWELLTETIHDLSLGKNVNIPCYDFTTHSRSETEFESIHGSIADVVIVEGILVFHCKEIVDMLDMKLFVDTDCDTRLARRVVRDINDRGRSLEGVLSQYERFVKPAFDSYIMPTKKLADVVIPRGASNDVAVGVIVQHIQGKLEEKDYLRKEVLDRILL